MFHIDSASARHRLSKLNAEENLFTFAEAKPGLSKD